jgi:hypothetical protein
MKIISLEKEINKLCNNATPRLYLCRLVKIKEHRMHTWTSVGWVD